MHFSIQIIAQMLTFFVGDVWH